MGGFVDPTLHVASDPDPEGFSTQSKNQGRGRRVRGGRGSPFLQPLLSLDARGPGSKQHITLGFLFYCLVSSESHFQIINLNHYLDSV